MADIFHEQSHVTLPYPSLHPVFRKWYTTTTGLCEHIQSQNFQNTLAPNSKSRGTNSFSLETLCQWCTQFWEQTGLWQTPSGPMTVSLITFWALASPHFHECSMKHPLVICSPHLLVWLWYHNISKIGAFQTQNKTKSTLTDYFHCKYIRCF